MLGERLLAIRSLPAISGHSYATEGGWVGTLRQGRLSLVEWRDINGGNGLACGLTIYSRAIGKAEIHVSRQVLLKTVQMLTET
jgi:hypothetical protein